MNDCDMEATKLQEINEQIRIELKSKNTQMGKMEYQIKDLTKTIEKLREEMCDYQQIKQKFEKMTLEVKKIQAQVNI